jgi:chromosome segregation ATPase
MSEFAWEGGAVQENETEAENVSEPREKAEDSRNLTLSVNDFSALEERILRAVEVVRRERHARIAAEERATRAEEQLREQAPQLEQLEKDLNALRTERDHVRGRVERLLGQLDALEL